MAAWVQAVGSVLAILVAVLVANRQLEHTRQEARRNRSEAALAAASLAGKTLDQVADRLLAAARPRAGKTMGLALREHRTTELVQTLRELNVAELPPDTVVAFSTLRSRLFAVNSRITDIYRSEEGNSALEARREERVRSSLLTYDDALTDYTTLRDVLRTAHGLAAPEFDEPAALREHLIAARGAASVS